MLATEKSGQLFALTAVILGLAACGGSSTSVPGAPASAQGGVSVGTPNAPGATQGGASRSAPLACDLVTNQEAATFLGIDPTAVMKDGHASAIAGAGSLCSVTAGRGGSLQIAVDLNATDYPNEDGVTAISGLGDRARWRGTADGMNPGAIEVFKGSTLVKIIVSDSSGSFNWTLDALTALARAAVGRL